MRRVLSASLLLCVAFQPVASAAKAKSVVIYAAKSDEPPHVVSTIAGDLASQIDAIPGYEAVVSSGAIGSLGKATARRGAEMYFIVEATSYADGAEIAVVTPFSANDEPLGPSERIRLNDWRIPRDFDATSIFGDAAIPVASDSHRLLVPGGTQVVVSMLNTVSSASASANDTFAFRAVEDVIVGNYVVIKKGAPGQGTITSADGAASNGQAGKLGMRFDYIMSADGLKIPLTGSDRVASGEEKKGASSTATILGYAFLGVGGLFMHNFVRGGQMQIDPSARLTVYVDHNVHVAASELSGEQAGYAK